MGRPFVENRSLCHVPDDDGSVPGRRDSPCAVVGDDYTHHLAFMADWVWSVFFRYNIDGISLSWRQRLTDFHSQGLNFKVSRPRSSSLGKARRMIGDQNFALPILLFCMGSWTRTAPLWQVRRAISSCLHASNEALASERGAPRTASGLALNSTRMSIRWSLLTCWRIVVAKWMVLANGSSMSLNCPPKTITRTNEDSRGSCVSNCSSNCSTKRRLRLGTV